MYSHVMKFLAAAGLLALLPAIASAAAPGGAWRGVVTTTKKDVVMTIHLNSDHANIHLNDPFACDVLANLQNTNGDTTTYKVAIGANGGGLCDIFLGQALKVTTERDGGLRVRLDGGGDVWQGDLSQSSILSL